MKYIDPNSTLSYTTYLKSANPLFNSSVNCLKSSSQKSQGIAVVGEKMVSCMEPKVMLKDLTGGCRDQLDFKIWWTLKRLNKRTRNPFETAAKATERNIIRRSMTVRSNARRGLTAGLLRLWTTRTSVERSGAEPKPLFPFRRSLPVAMSLTRAGRIVPSTAWVKSRLVSIFASVVGWVRYDSCSGVEMVKLLNNPR